MKPSPKAPRIAAPPAVVDNSRTLRISPVCGKNEDQLVADAAVNGLACNAMTLATFMRGTFGDLSLTDCALALKETAGAVDRDDLSAAETVLTGQALALNAVFVEMARRAALNMGEYLPACETYMRLALKAQSQARATFETLAAIKNPPVVFARQANINNGGQQQVNNGSLPETNAQPPARAHAGNSEIAQTELLEDQRGKRLDFGTTEAAERAYSQLATLGAINRPPHGGGEGTHEDEPIPRRAKGRTDRAEQAATRALR